MILEGLAIFGPENPKALEVIIVHACTMIIVPACTMILVHVLWGFCLPPQQTKRYCIYFLHYLLRPLVLERTQHMVRGLIYELLGCRTHFQRITHASDTNYLISLQQIPLNLHWGVHLKY